MSESFPFLLSTFHSFFHGLLVPGCKEAVESLSSQTPLHSICLYVTFQAPKVLPRCQHLILNQSAFVGSEEKVENHQKSLISFFIQRRTHTYFVNQLICQIVLTTVLIISFCQIGLHYYFENQLIFANLNSLLF